MGFSPSRLMGFPHQPNSARFDFAIFWGDSPCPEAAPPTGSTRYRNQAFTVWVSPWSVWCRTEATVEERSPKDTAVPPQVSALLDWRTPWQPGSDTDQPGKPWVFDWPFTPRFVPKINNLQQLWLASSMATSAWNLREEHRIIPWGFY
jgi:hypothetical protein